tara:strand:- start:39469 stop:39942 length:474 start_codon:yes stop_codon:yes gene_type:complete
MKYHRLSQDQLNSVYKQFIFFLSSKGIDKKHWDSIKKEKNNKISLLLDEFSDIIWEEIINKCSFFTFNSNNQLFFFNPKKTTISVIVIKCLNRKKNIQTNKGWNWILNNIKHKDLSFYQSSRKYPEERNKYIYKYLKKGATISDGKKFKSLKTCFSI